MKKKIFIIKNRAIGDSILTLAAVRYLKTIYPELTIHYGVPQNLSTIFKNTLTSADKIIPISWKSFRGIIQVFKILYQERYQLIIDLHQTGRTKNIFKILKFFSFLFFFPCPYVFHNHHKKSFSGIPDQGLPIPNIQRDLNACWFFLQKIFSEHHKHHPCPPSYLLYNPIIKIKEGYKPSKIATDQSPIFVFGVVATRQTKLWPLAYFKKLYDLITTKWTKALIIIPLSTSKFDQTLLHEWTLLFPANHQKQYVILQESLENLPSSLIQATLYVGNDTGLKHLAAALGISTITLFGPEEPTEWHPYSNKHHPFLFFQPLSCRVQDQHFCNLSYCIHKTCLHILTPHQVMEKICQLSDILTPLR